MRVAHERDATALSAASAEAHARLRAAERLAEIRKREAGAAQVASLAESAAHDRQVAQLERRLRDGAPEIVEGAAKWLCELRDTARLQTETVRDGHADRDLAGYRPERWTSNIGDVQRFVSDVNAALAALERMRLAPSFEGLTERVRELCESIPLHSDGTPDIAPPSRAFNPVTAGEARELRWRAEERLARLARERGVPAAMNYALRPPAAEYVVPDSRQLATLSGRSSILEAPGRWATGAGIPGGDYWEAGASYRGRTRRPNWPHLPQYWYAQNTSWCPMSSRMMVMTYCLSFRRAATTQATQRPLRPGGSRSTSRKSVAPLEYDIRVRQVSRPMSAVAWRVPPTVEPGSHRRFFNGDALRIGFADDSCFGDRLTRHARGGSASTSGRRPRRRSSPGGKAPGVSPPQARRFVVS